ncbi:hypothetical protein L6164_022852 [Bauhinia variegata]|uniref:Uncharacterized protein n=2 Tax=Bauhinia variegata TaxID=167791 RepID=A0ACB9MGH4_BAUVA|nr:hypothetical protein L6164_022852 [Bauhinia variegata]
MSSLRFWLASLATHKPLSTSSPRFFVSSPRDVPRINNCRNLCCCLESIKQTRFISEASKFHSSSLKDAGIFGMEDALVSYLFGKKRATDVPHMIWKHIVQKGDSVVDATCGNGFDTLAMLKLVADDSGEGCVYAMDIQKDALDSTSSLLEESVDPHERQLIKLFHICHSKMEEIVPENASVRLVAFNLGYLPGGDKEIITRSETTLLALEAAKRILMRGGLISIVVYVGHPGGWEELKVVEGFAARMSTEDWICCKLQMLNRPNAPIPIFLFRR